MDSRSPSRGSPSPLLASGSLGGVGSPQAKESQLSRSVLNVSRQATPAQSSLLRSQDIGSVGSRSESPLLHGHSPSEETKATPEGKDVIIAEEIDLEKRKRKSTFWKKKKPQIQHHTEDGEQENEDKEGIPVIYPDDDPDTVNQKKTIWRKSGEIGPKSIGSPYNVVHKSHVNFNYEWTLKNPNETFEMADLLGTGTFGSVYRARHRESGFSLAIKVIKFKGQEGLEEVNKEINILKKLKHTNIVSYYGSCMPSQSELWVLMEYCNVGSVRDFMGIWPEPFSEDQIATILYHTLSGLAYLHDNKIAHRDIKSANILLDGQGRSKIADFGVAGQLTRSFGQMHDFVGTILFMAPEMLKDRATYDVSTDIWAIGITTIELAEQGYVPHCSDRAVAVIRKIANNPPPTFSEPSKWSNQFKDFLSCCLQKDPKARPKAKMLLMHPFIMAHRNDTIQNVVPSNDTDSSASSTPIQAVSLTRGSASSSSRMDTTNPTTDNTSTMSSFGSGLNQNMLPYPTGDPLKQPLPVSRTSPNPAGHSTNSAGNECCCVIV